MSSDLSQSLRILYVDTDRVWRGGQDQLFSLITGMQERTHRVWLAAPADAPLTDRARRAGVPTCTFRQRNEVSPLAFYRLRKILGQQQFDVVHLNGPRAFLLAALATHSCGVPVRVSSRRVNFPLKSRLSHLKYNWGGGRIITVSFSICQTLRKGGVRPELISVIYEGVDLGWIDCLERAALHPCDELIVGTVAHMSPEKGHWNLLKAAAQLIPTFPGVRFVLVGSGELDSALRRAVHELKLTDHFLFTGFRSDSEALSKNFDIFCLPSLSEGLSSAIMVAMANSLPVVATSVGGTTELVVDGETGLLVPPQEPSSLATALLKLLESAELRAGMGAAGRRRVEQKFTLQRKLDETETLYRELLKEVLIG